MPFGTGMRPSGEVVLVAGYESEHATPVEIIQLIKEGFAKEMSTRGYMATALAYDALTLPPGRTEKMDAIAVELDHRDDYSVIVFQTYRIVEGGPNFEPLFASKGRAEVFPQKKA